MAGRDKRRGSQIAVLGCLIIFPFVLLAGAADSSIVREGIVTDESGASIANARLIVQSTQGSVLQERFTGEDGTFSVSGLPLGSYVLKVKAGNFQAREMSLELTPLDTSKLKIVLSLEWLRNDVTVTARRGTVEEIESAANIITAKDQLDFQRPLVTIGNALENSAGIMVQQSTFGQVSPFLRGLTGYQVLNLIDGIRFNNSTFRSGPNQYLAFVEPSQAQRIEALLGPTGSQYGSDALGGTIQVLTLEPRFDSEGRFGFHGDLQTFGASADASSGANLGFSLGSDRRTLLVGATLRRHNDLRAGRGRDSRHVFHRFFGLSDDQIQTLEGSRQQDTGFTQYGWHTKLAMRLAGDNNLTLWYQQSDLDRVRSYKDLWGGLGRLRYDFAPQGLQFFYARYEKLSLGFIDSLTGTFSVNSQEDGSVRQGLQSTDPIVDDDVSVKALGYSLQGTTHLGRRHALVFGGEIYDERIGASRFDFDPRTNLTVQKRARYPDGSRYTTYGLFAQNSADLVHRKLRAVIAGRFTGVDFRTFAERNRDASGSNLGVIDVSQTYQDLTFNTSLVWQVNELLALNFLVGRGFRSPNLNDLGALGLNDLGYEVPGQDAAAFSGLIGSSDGEDALSTGRNVDQLAAERMFNYEFGVTVRHRRYYARAHVFDAELKDPIVRRTLLFSDGLVPPSLSGIPVSAIAATPSQRSQGVATVATSADPRAVKAFVNDGQIRYYGVDAVFHYSFSSRVSADGNYTYLVGRELNPNRFVRRLPPQQGFLALHYQPEGGRFWVDVSGNLVGAQDRLSGGDLTDERIGASRRRRDILDFFQGSLVRRYIQPGLDGVIGTADDLFAPTGETSNQIRDRVLPLGAVINGVEIVDDNSRVPLFVSNPGFVSFTLSGGFRLTENSSVNLALLNLLDRNYRIHGSGIAAPGINVFVSLKYSF
jgi:hemoglobin/transferrin/lactoferrin receptor protein